MDEYEMQAFELTQQLREFRNDRMNFLYLIGKIERLRAQSLTYRPYIKNLGVIANA